MAYDSLSLSNKNFLDLGIEQAKSVQQSIVRIGTLLIERKEVKVAQNFRYIMIENDYLKDVNLF